MVISQFGSPLACDTTYDYLIRGWAVIFSLPYLWKVEFPSQKVANQQLHRAQLDSLRKTDSKHFFFPFFKNKGPISKWWVCQE